MKISVVTPSFRNSDWLKLCVASVADQEGVEFEHIVQDACSDDGTQQWLLKDRRVKAFIEKDGGMYDAINRGFRRASGDVLAHLNADEQYLPNALKRVAVAFHNRPGTDLVIADIVVTDKAGQYICSRKAMPPSPLTSWTKMSTSTAALFIKRSFIEKNGLYFDTRWKGVADFVWMNKALAFRPRIQVLRAYTSAFTETGNNLSSQQWFAAEQENLQEIRPSWSRKLHALLVQLHRFRSMTHGSYWTKPFHYEVYTLANPGTRKLFSATKPTTRWRGRE